MKLARRLIKQLGGRLDKVEVENAHQLSPELIVLSFVRDNVRYVDIFNALGKELMDTLLSVVAGKKVTVTLVDDKSADQDNHPEVLSAQAE